MFLLKINSDPQLITYIISSGAVIVSIISFIWRTNLQRKKDINKLFEKKADKELVEEKINNQHKLILTQELRLNEHDEKNNLQFRMNEKQIDSIGDKVEETRVELSRKIDHVQDVIINLINGKHE